MLRRKVNNFAVASRFWVGGTGSWDGSTTTHWSATSGGAGGASVPTASDTVTFDTASNGANYTVTITAAAHCSDLTIGQPSAGTLTFAGASALEVAGNFSIASGVSRTYTGAITFSATATGKTLTFNGITMNSNMTFNGSGGGWTFQDALNDSAKTITLTTGTLDTNGKAVTADSISSSGAGTRTLTLGASALTLSGTTPIDFVSSLTLNANTSTITLSQVGTITFNGGGLTFQDVAFSALGNSSSMTGANTFNNLTLTGGTSINGGISFASDITVNGTLTVTGNSVGKNRVYLLGGKNGVQKTITAAVVSLTNVDFRDTVGAGAATWSGTSIGNGGNNSGITFTTPVTRYYVGNTGNWSATSSWSSSSGGASGATAPILHDTAIFDSHSFSSSGQTVTFDPQRICSIDFTNVTNSPTIDSSAGNLFFGDFLLKSGMTFTAATSNTISGEVANYSINTNGVSLGGAWNIDTGIRTYTLNAAINFSDSTQNLSFFSGTFDANDFNLTAGKVIYNVGATMSILMGNGIWSLTGTGTIWGFSSTTGLTFDAEGSTIDCTNSTGTSRTVTAGSLTLNHLKVSAGTGTVTFTNVNCNNLDFTGFTGTFAAASSDTSIRGNLTLGSGMTVGNSGLNDFIFTATSGTKTITSNGVAIVRNITFNGVGGTWQLADAISLTNPRTITLTNGTFDANNFNVTLGGFLSNNSNTRTLTMGSGTWTFPGTGSVWTGNTGTNMTLNANTSTILISDTSSTQKTFSPASTGTQTFSTIRVDGDNVVLNFGFTLLTLFLNNPGLTNGTILQNSNTYTLTNLTAQGTAGNLIKLASSSASLVATLSKAGFNTDCDYMSVTRIQGTGGARWFVGEHSTDGGGNKGLRFAQASNRQHSPGNNVASI